MYSESDFPIGNFTFSTCPEEGSIFYNPQDNKKSESGKVAASDLHCLPKRKKVRSDEERRRLAKEANVASFLIIIYTIS